MTARRHPDYDRWLPPEDRIPLAEETPVSNRWVWWMHEGYSGAWLGQRRSDRIWWKAGGSSHVSEYTHWAPEKRGGRRAGSGPKPKAEADRRGARVVVCCTAMEARAWTRCAEAEGLSRSEWVRRLVSRV